MNSGAVLRFLAAGRRHRRLECTARCWWSADQPLARASAGPEVVAAIQAERSTAEQSRQRRPPRPPRFDSAGRTGCGQWLRTRSPSRPPMRSALAGWARLHVGTKRRTLDRPMRPVHARAATPNRAAALSSCHSAPGSIGSTRAARCKCATAEREEGHRARAQKCPSRAWSARSDRRHPVLPSRPFRPSQAAAETRSATSDAEVTDAHPVGILWRNENIFRASDRDARVRCRVRRPARAPARKMRWPFLRA